MLKKIDEFFKLLESKASNLLRCKPSQPPAKTIPAKTTPAKTTPAKKEIYVYVTLKGKKFHYDRACTYILNSKDFRMELSKAREAGYTACDKCCYDYLHK